MKRILVVNGPNLNLLGSREPDVYGRTTLAGIEAMIQRRAEELGCDVTCFQSNSEGAILDFLQREAPNASGMVINPGALTHYSWSLRDALECFEGVKIEVHLSNPSARERFRRTSTIAGVVDGTIAGLGQLGYELAVLAVGQIIAARD